MGSWPAPPLTLHTRKTVEVRGEEKHSSRVGTEGWDRLLSLHPLVLGAAHAAGECCPWLTGSAAQPCPAGAALLLLPGARGPSCCPNTRLQGWHGVRDPNATPAPPSLVCCTTTAESSSSTALLSPLWSHLSCHWVTGRARGATLATGTASSTATDSQRLPGRLETPSSTQYCYCAKRELYSLLWSGFFSAIFF